jgi:hypothetical protein
MLRGAAVTWTLVEQIVVLVTALVIVLGLAYIWLFGDD